MFNINVSKGGFKINWDGLPPQVQKKSISVMDDVLVPISFIGLPVMIFGSTLIEILMRE